MPHRLLAKLSGKTESSSSHSSSNTPPKSSCGESKGTQVKLHLHSLEPSKHPDNQIEKLVPNSFASLHLLSRECTTSHSQDRTFPNSKGQFPARKNVIFASERSRILNPHASADNLRQLAVGSMHLQSRSLSNFHKPVYANSSRSLTLDSQSCLNIRKNGQPSVLPPGSFNANGEWTLSRPNLPVIFASEHNARNVADFDSEYSLLQRKPGIESPVTFQSVTDLKSRVNNLGTEAVYGKPSTSTIGKFQGGIENVDSDNCGISNQNSAICSPVLTRSRAMYNFTSTPEPTHKINGMPSHPAPIRLGLLQDESNKVQSSFDMTSSSPNVSGASLPATPTPNMSKQVMSPQKINELRLLVERNPDDKVVALELAKGLAGVTNSLISRRSSADSRAVLREIDKLNTEAISILKKLMASSYTPAKFFMADCYSSGYLGLTCNAKEAFSLYQSAATLGHAESAYRTAVCYEIGFEEGGGTRKDYEKAIHWYKKAASLQDGAAMYKLGMIYLKGLLGQAVNEGEAVTWLKRAAKFADEDNPYSLHELALLYAEDRRGSRLTADPIFAFKLFEQAAHLGYKLSQYQLGLAYEYGLLGQSVDNRASIAWYSRAAAQGEHESELALSGWYLTGCQGILEKNDTEAYLWARLAAVAQPPVVKALFAMGYYNEIGIGCPRNLEEAKRWYARAAAYKYPKAQERLNELKNNEMRVPRGRERLIRSSSRQKDECKLM